jgi:acetyl-CoA acetyltransferase
MPVRSSSHFHCRNHRAYDLVLFISGSASQISDGAAAVLFTHRSVAKRLHLPIVGKFVFASVVGVPPRIMGVGPVFAIPKVLKSTGLSKGDVVGRLLLAKDLTFVL